jgi:hypothetical protein
MAQQQQQNKNDQDTRGQSNDRITRENLNSQAMFNGRNIDDGPPKREGHMGSVKAIDVPAEFKKAGFEYRWFNQVPGRIERAKEYGWEVVNDERLQRHFNPSLGTAASKTGSAVTRTGSSGTTVFLMHIPKKWLDEYQRRKEATLDRFEKDMRLSKGDQLSVKLADGNTANLTADETSEARTVFMEQIKNE